MTPQHRLAAREFFGIKLGLDTIGTLVEALGHPERAFVPIIVAGTNGKGSVTAMVARALHAARLRVGRYTSPHLVHLRERYAIDEVDVADAALDAALQAVFDAEDALLERGALAGPATYFELTTAAAFVLFRSAGVQVAVIEVGLGGRHDATNVVRAPYAAISSIAFDHLAQLGNTLALIAAEKAGVVMPGAIVVSGVDEPEAAAVIAKVCADRQARLVLASQDVVIDATESGGDTTLRLETPWRRYGPVTLALPGAHQVAVGLQFTLPGVPMVFAGDEIGLEGVSGEDARRPMPWHRPEAWDHETLATYAALAAARHDHVALRRGGLRWAHVGDDTLAFLREHPEETLLVVARRAPGPPLELPIDVGEAVVATADDPLATGVSVYRI